MRAALIVGHWRCLCERGTQQSCKNVQTVRTSRCYFFWPVLIFGKSTRKTGENTRKQAKNSAFLVLNFLWAKLVGANFYAFCNYASKMADHIRIAKVASQKLAEGGMKIITINIEQGNMQLFGE